MIRKYLLYHRCNKNLEAYKPLDYNFSFFFVPTFDIFCGKILSRLRNIDVKVEEAIFLFTCSWIAASQGENFSRELFSLSLCSVSGHSLEIIRDAGTKKKKYITLKIY